MAGCPGLAFSQPGVHGGSKWASRGRSGQEPRLASRGTEVRQMGSGLLEGRLAGGQTGTGECLARWCLQPGACMCSPLGPGVGGCAGGASTWGKVMGEWCCLVWSFLPCSRGFQVDSRGDCRGRLPCVVSRRRGNGIALCPETAWEVRAGTPRFVFKKGG